jgi:hypothetical protein
VPASHWIRARLVPLELRLAGRLAFLQRVPLLRRLYRRVTARVAVHAGAPGGALVLRVDFETPYLGLPVEVEKAQIGTDVPPNGLEPASFRFFDWHSWQHIGGEIAWTGERDLLVAGRRVGLVTGFTYRAGPLPVNAGNLGLRIAEGVEGTIRVNRGDDVARMGFEPGYWLLKPDGGAYRQVAICQDELMALIVSLSEIGSADPEVQRRAVEHLWDWVRFHLSGEIPERALRRLLHYVKDWGPLDLVPLYQGLKVVLERLGVRDSEQILFDFYADHWGVRSNRDARLLAIRTLDALGTEAARSALCDLLAYARNRVLDPDELDLLQSVARPSVTAADSPSCPPDPT